MASSTLPPKFVESLKTILNPTDWVVDGDQLNLYALDWTLGFKPKASGLCFPRNTQQVSQILRLCSINKISIVPSGGRTGLSAGAVAANGEIVLSLEKMNKTENIDLSSKTIRVEAGVKNQSVQEICAPYNLHWPVDLASKGSATIGGNIATNAGGLRVIRYGHTRNWVLSIETVLMSGEVLELGGGLEKNNAGFDLKQLVIGSEGTLGVVTAATLKLASLPAESQVCLLGLKRSGDLPLLLNALNTSQAVALAFEVGSKKCFDLVCKVRQLKSPFQKSFDYFVLVEIENFDLPAGVKFLENLSSLQQSGVIDEILVSSSDKDKKFFWQFRENITESLRATGTVYKNDLSVPVSKISQFIEALEAESHKLYPNLEVFLFGHAGDGNVHVNVLNSNAALPAERFFKFCEAANHKLYALVQQFKGSIAAEHGIGLLKKSFLHYTRSQPEIEIMRQTKNIWDPSGLLNPGKIFSDA